MRRITPNLTAAALGLAILNPASVRAEDTKIRHVLVISFDDMHSLDMAPWVKSNPSSTLANLTSQGMDFTNASSTEPSDSIPSTVGIYTGASPARRRLCSGKATKLRGQ